METVYKTGFVTLDLTANLLVATYSCFCAMKDRLKNDYTSLTVPFL